MKLNSSNAFAFFAVLALALVVPAAAHAGCSTATTAGAWGYTYTGSIFTTAGPIPAASVGHYSQDLAGNVKGSQSRSVAGSSAVEDISGTVTVNSDCTGSATINVLVGGVLQRTAVLAMVWDKSRTQVRAIFQSLTLPDGTNVPVVLTMEGDRISYFNF